MFKQTFITEINKLLLIYCSVSHFLEKKQEKSKIISPANQRPFRIKKTSEKGELNLQIANLKRKKIETTDKKVHNLQLTQTGKKRKKEMETIDFISVRKQQNLKEEAEINPIEIKSEKNKV